MTAKGFSQVSGESADLLVGYHVGIQDKLSVQTIDTYYDYYPGGRIYRGRYVSPPMTSRTVVDSYEQGTLIIDFMDQKTRQLVWRGIGQARVHEASSPEQRTKRVNQAVTEILAQYPPQ